MATTDGKLLTITVVSAQPGAFRARWDADDGVPSWMLPEVSSFLGPVGIERIVDGVQGLIINTSPRILRVNYLSLRPGQEGEVFGPVLDFILPMHAKEIGAAPGSVLWWVAPAYTPPADGPASPG